MRGETATDSEKRKLVRGGRCGECRRSEDAEAHVGRRKHLSSPLTARDVAVGSVHVTVVTAATSF